MGSAWAFFYVAKSTHKSVWWLKVIKVFLKHPPAHASHSACNVVHLHPQSEHTASTAKPIRDECQVLALVVICGPFTSTEPPLLQNKNHCSNPCWNRIFQPLVGTAFSNLLLEPFRMFQTLVGTPLLDLAHAAFMVFIQTVLGCGGLHDKYWGPCMSCPFKCLPLDFSFPCSDIVPKCH